MYTYLNKRFEKQPELKNKISPHKNEVRISYNHQFTPAHSAHPTISIISGDDNFELYVASSDEPEENYQRVMDDKGYEKHAKLKINTDDTVVNVKVKFRQRSREKFIKMSWYLSNRSTSLRSSLTLIPTTSLKSLSHPFL